MKKILLISTTILLISCGGKKEQSVETVLASGNLETIRAKKVALDAKKQTLAAQIKQLNDKISELDTNKKVPLITTFTAKKEEFAHFLELQGNVQTKQNVLIYPEMAGQLRSVFVKEGQKVTKGQVLGRIDDGGMANQLAQVVSAEAFAKTTFDRQKRLWDQKIGSEIQYLQAKTNYESQKNAVENLKRTLGKYSIRAPFSGVIDDVMKEQGTVVAPGPGSEIFRIVNLSKMYIETAVPESYITSIKKGKKVSVEFPVLGTTINSTVRQAGNFINPSNRTFKVEVAVDNKDRSIKPNLTAKLKINDYTNKEALLIPQSIISENANGEQYVYVVTDLKDKIGKAKQVIIVTGKTQGDVVEVLKGIQKGDQIVMEGARSVQNGQQVQVLN